MATPQIGSISFAIMRGQVNPLAESVRALEREGLDGADYKRLGKRSAPARITTIADFDTAQAALDHVSDCFSLQGGAPVTITYADGGSSSGVMILDVRFARYHHSSVTAGGLTSGAYIVALEWTVALTSPSGGGSP
ncbi:MAG TPA: hypothetical protein P5137_00985 [Candidatus Brocadiia bacterium]|nr:hypothetical protein [Candidatus Brocadiia bacterium]